MSNEIKKMNYFDGLLLKEEDLKLDQDYHTKFQRLHNRFFHEWGIVDGLTVEEVPNFPMVIVKKGLAINRIEDEITHEKLSQEIWITEGHPDNPVDLSQCDVGKNIFITVSYEEAKTDIDNNKGGDKEIHIWERARIKYDTKRPVDISKDIVVACLKLKNDEYNNKVIDKDSIKYDFIVDDKQKIPVCKYAVTQGTAREFQKISIGEKDKLDLPYISGLNDGLEIHSPCTKFTGTVLGEDLKTNGDVEVNGALTVKANGEKVLSVDSKDGVAIKSKASTENELTVKGGLNVTGDKTVLGTTNVEMTGNTLLINKYPPDKSTEAEKACSGIEVYRGKEPSAKIIWDEDVNKWKIGTDKKSEAGTDKKDEGETEGLHIIPYGKKWEDMVDGSTIDYHKHSAICTSKGTPVLQAITGDKDKVSIKALGSIIADFGIEAPGENTTARLVWNKDKKHWKIGTDEKMYDVAYGDEWETLSSKKNADQLHKHSEFYNNSGDIKSMTTSADGNVKIENNLEVAKNLKVTGDLTVIGKATEYKSVSQVVNENVVLVNKPSKVDQNTKGLNTEGGLEVYRGEGIDNARLIWDEGSKSWKIGTGKLLYEMPCGEKWEDLIEEGFVDNLHKHSNLYKQDGAKAIAVEENGNVSVNSSLTVTGDLKITGTVINKKTVEVEDSVIIVNKYSGEKVPLKTDGGMEVYRGGQNPNARLVWSESQGKWKIGIGKQMYDIPYGEEWDKLIQKDLADKLHYHSILCDKAGRSALEVSEGGVISISNDAKVGGKVSVDGSMTVNGDFKVNGDTTYVNKEVLQVSDSVILLNNYVGDKFPGIDSGIEIYRGSEPKARLVWEEESKKWKLGIDGNLEEIACGDGLSSHKNADTLHLHGQLYNENGDILALSTRATGSVDVAHDLSVGQDLTVLGALNVKGPLTRIDSKTIEILSNSITISRFDSGSTPQIKSGLTVYRGSGSTKNAVMVWDEVNGCFKIGMLTQSSMNENTKDNDNLDLFKVKADGSIMATGAIVKGSFEADSAIINGAVSVKEGIVISRVNEVTPSIKWLEDTKRWKIGTNREDGISVTEDGKVGIANPNPKEKLDVNGNGVISENFVVGKNTIVNGNLTAGSAEILGSIKIKGKETLERGLEVYRGSDSEGNQLQPAKISWDESSKCWKFGIGNELVKLDLNGKISEHNHSKLWTESGSGVSVSTDSKGNVGIGTNAPKTKLDVDGSATVRKNLIADSIEVTNDAVVNGKVITNSPSFEYFRGKDIPNAKLFWNESRKTWQAGPLGPKDELKDIFFKDDTLKINEGKIGIGIDPLSTLDVGGDTKIRGNLYIDNGIVGTTSQSIKGLIKWNTQTNTWQAGQEGQEGGLKNISYEGHTHDGLTNGLKIISDALKVDGSNIGIGLKGNEKPVCPLDVGGNTKIRGDLYTEMGIIGTTSSTIRGQIKWNKQTNTWQAGLEGQEGGLKDISCKGHTHDELTNGLKTITDALKVDGGKIGIGLGNTTPIAAIDIGGETKFRGNLYIDQAIIGVTSQDKRGQIKWNTETNTWQAGLEGQEGGLKDISCKGHTHDELTNGLKTITDALKVDGGKIGIGLGNVTPIAAIDIGGETKFRGNLYLDQAIIGATSPTIRGQIKWNTKTNTWQAGLEGQEGGLKDISCEGHTHDGLKIDATGNVEMGKIGSNLNLYGTIATIKGKLSAEGNIETLTGKVNSKDAGITGTLSAANVCIGKETMDTGVKLDVAGNAKVNGTLTVNNEIYVKTADNKTLKISFIYNTESKKWELDTQESKAS